MRQAPIKSNGMLIRSNRNKDRDTLEKEYARLSSDIHAIETGNEKAIGLGLSVISIGLAYGIKEKIDVVFLMLPIALIGVFLFGTLRYYNLFWLGGYKRAIEEKINELAGRTVICWESLVHTQKRRVNVINGTLASVYLGFLVAVTWISIQRIVDAYGLFVGLIYGAIELCLSIFLFWGVVQMFDGYDEALSFGRKNLLSASENSDIQEL